MNATDIRDWPYDTSIIEKLSGSSQPLNGFALDSLRIRSDLSSLGVYMWEQICETPPQVNRVCNILSEAYVTPNITLFWVHSELPGHLRASVYTENGEDMNPDFYRSQTKCSDDLTILETPHPERNDEYPAERDKCAGIAG